MIEDIVAKFNIQTSITAFFIGVGIITTLTLFRWFMELVNAKRRAHILEIDLQRKAIKDENDKLSLDDLTSRANKRYGGKPDGDTTH